ncbi:MAG: aminodeoxychorismate lyase [Gammaproteobacteria bacterium]|nr:aminodeoxychorismate lyase [Gammaproteobacteria bacterium]
MALVNGSNQSTVPVQDRGLLYGDGVFETIAVRDAVPRQLDRHLRRLRNGCDRLAIDPPAMSLLKAEAMLLCAGVERAVLKIIITRGQGGRGYRPSVETPPTRILIIIPWPEHSPDYHNQGIAILLCRTRLARNPLLAGIKHLNRLEQVLARAEWQDEYQEGLLLDTEGVVVEGTMSNVFAVRGETLHTPALDCAGVAGIMRERIIEQANLAQTPVTIGELSVDDLERADAVFFCNSLIGIWPVRQFGARSYRAHPLVRDLVRRLDAA